MKKDKIINRINILQNIIDRKKAKTYLEIGVRSGDAFLKIKATRKLGVDPNFVISPIKKFRYYFKNPYNVFNEYFDMESDTFFAQENTRLSEHALDVVFIDGLHTFEQSLKDVQNSLVYLNDNGVIVLHDCNPLSEAAAFPAVSIEEVQKINPPGFEGIWNGDVWKTIVYLRSTRKDLRVFVLDCDFGLGVITKDYPENMLNYSPNAVHNLSYNDLAKERESLINLKNLNYLQEFLK